VTTKLLGVQQIAGETSFLLNFKNESPNDRNGWDFLKHWVLVYLMNPSHPKPSSDHLKLI